MIIKKARLFEAAKKIKECGKHVVVYGVGMIGQVVIPYIVKRYNLYECIDYFVDIDYRKQGQKITIGSKEYRIESPDFLHTINKNQVLFITNSKFYSVLEYLDGFLELNSTEAYIIPLMQIYELEFSNRTQIQKITKMQVIPKKIHYCWFSKKTIPPFLQECISTWREKCPDYEIIEWNEDNYDVTKFRYMKDAYENGKYGFVTDLARLDILYNQGGIYMDTDVTLYKSLDELLYQDAFVGVEKWGNINTGGGCGAVRQHPMIKELLEYRVGVDFILEDGSINIDTNGIYETIPFMKRGMRIDNTLQNIADVTIYPSSVFHPYDYVSCETKIEECTISKHHFYGGWMEKGDLNNREKTKKKYVQILNKME